jgi:hypothetical protein
MKTRISPILITFALVCFALLKNTGAADGGYPGVATQQKEPAHFLAAPLAYTTRQSVTCRS